MSSPACGQTTVADVDLFRKSFDAHWQRLKDSYPYFELYEVDWAAERADHRPRALAARNATEFAWEMARLISALPDAHVSFRPAISTIKGRWSKPDTKSALIGRRPFVVEWADGDAPKAPPAFADDPRAYPEILTVRGFPVGGAADILAAGPVGATVDIRLRWPDGTETDHALHLPKTSNLPPPAKHYGKKWLVTGRVGSVGYMRIRTFSPKSATLGPDGKMTTMLRAALRQLADTDGLIIDLQGNGGGLVSASDPFLGNLIRKRMSYAWGRSGGQKRVITPRSPCYRGKVVCLVNNRSASGGEWTARILRDAGRAIVVGERTAGAEAAVHTSKAPDGSIVRYGACPMAEPGVTPFQERGIQIDHKLPLTIEIARKHGVEKARQLVRRARMEKAVELIGADADVVEALLKLAAYEQ